MSRLPPLEPGQPLDPDGLKLVGEALFGSWGWQTRMAEALEVDGSTVRRWVSGAVAVPNPAKVALRLMLREKGMAPPVAPVPAPEKLPARPRSVRKG
jgi:hypothetical protein